MKQCGTCKQALSLDSFNKNKSKKDGHSAVCRACQKVYKDNHYAMNKDKVQLAVKKRRQDIIDFIWAYKSNHSCVDCGFSDPKALDFDHVRGEKKYNLSQMSELGLGRQKILDEIAKCDVRCSNCHRIATHDRAKRVRNITVDAEVMIMGT
jgi:hypothetical protein